MWMSYQNVDTTFWDPYPSYVDSTQHIDMWMQVTADAGIVISDWPYNPGSAQDVICDNAAAIFALAGYSVYRVPARSVGGIHYTYTNVVMCNDLVLIPLYTNSSVVQHNAEALAAWQAAVPGKTVVQINSQSIVSAAGVLHCIVMHVPLPLGGENPTTYLVKPRSGAIFQPGAEVDINWISDDDHGVTEVDILLSVDGGSTFPITVVSGTADDGSYTWTVPNMYAAACRLRIVVHDADGNSGYDDSDGNFTIDGLYGDYDIDGTVSLADYAWWDDCATGPDNGPYDPGCEAFDADADVDVDVGDFAAFQAAFAP
jgi:hypothetical protein